METIMFAVGALSMVLLAVASLAVYSTVMVLKLKDELKLTHKMIDDVYGTINHVNREQSHEIENLRSYVDRRIDKMITDPKFCLNKEPDTESKKIIKG
jgi:hypothetical protein